MSFKKSELFVLRDRIKGLAEEGRSHGRALSGLRGPERAAERGEKRGVGRTARAHLLAYALLRGMPYASVERRSDPSRARGLVPEVADVMLMHSGNPGGPTMDSDVLEWMSGDDKEAAR